MEAELSVSIEADTDLILARQEGRRLASEAPFSSSDLTVIAVAISEVARNILEYAGHGEVQIRLLRNGERSGVSVVAMDRGQGIPDIPLALEEGYSTSGGLGLGLSVMRRLMDEFEIQSEPGQGTTISMRKWAT